MDEAARTREPTSAPEPGGPAPISAPAEAGPVTGSGPLTPGRVLALQASAGNAAVARELARWTAPLGLTRKTQAELIRDGIGGDTNAIGEVTDFSSVSEADRLTMVDHLTDQVWVGSTDAAALERIWGSFPDFIAVATANLPRWRRCCARHTGLVERVPAALRVRNAFADDIREVARGNLRTNREFVLAEMRRFGVSEDAQAAVAEPNAEQAGELARLQVVAEGLAKLQYAQEAARETPVGLQLDRQTETARYWRRARYRPGEAPPPAEIPRSESYQSDYVYDEATENYVAVSYHGEDDTEAWIAHTQQIRELTSIKPHAQVDAAYHEVESAAAAILTAFPQLFAVSVDGSRGTSEFARADSPTDATAALGAAFRRLLGNIRQSEANLADGSLDPLDLTPIHERLMASTDAGRPSGVVWSQAFPHSEAENLVRGHNIDRALRQLLLQTVAELAFLFAPLAGPAAIPLMLAGTTALGANLVLDASRYEALAAAARTHAQPGTQLVTPQAVDEARMAVEADTLAFALAAMALGGAAARAAIGRIRAAMAARALARRNQLIRAVGAPSGVETWRPNEVPYTPPPDLQVARPGQPLNVRALDPNKRYLWVIDPEGNFRVAAEGQGQMFPRRPALPRGHPQAGQTPIKHGDLVPGEGGATRGTARAGGELIAERGPDGRPTGRWLMDNNSSYTFARTDGQTLSGANLQAAHDLLGTTGTDTGLVVPRNTAGIDAAR